MKPSPDSYKPTNPKSIRLDLGNIYPWATIDRFRLLIKGIGVKLSMSAWIPVKSLIGLLLLHTLTLVVSDESLPWGVFFGLKWSEEIFLLWMIIWTFTTRGWIAPSRFDPSVSIPEFNSSLKTLVDGLPVCICYVDRHLIYRFANHTYEQWFEKPLDTVINHPLRTVIGEKFYQISLPLIERVLAGNRVIYETQYAYSSGTRFVKGTLIPDRNSSGEVIGYYALIENISQQKQIENALKQSEAKFSAAFYGNPDSLTISSIEEDQFLEINPSFYQVTGYSPPEVVGKTSSSLRLWVNPLDRSAMIEVVKRSGQIQNYETHFRVKSGDHRIASVSAQMININGNQYLLSVIKDITQRKRVELALQQSEAELRAVFQAMPDIVLMFDRSGRHLRIPPVHSELLFAAASELLGKRIQDIMPGKQADLFVQWIEQVLESQQVLQREYEVNIQNKTICFNASIAPMGSDNVLWVGRDVTQFKEIENRLTKITNMIPSAVFEYCIEASGKEYFIFISQGIEVLYGIPPDRILDNKTCMWEVVLPAYIIPLKRSILLSRNKFTRWSSEYEIETPQGERKWINGEAIPDIDDRYGTVNWYGILTDITIRKQYEVQLELQTEQLQSVNQKLLHLAHYDSLTEVANRRYFDQYLDSEWYRTSQQHTTLSLILCDVDYFKRYNDTYGHPAGDRCLNLIAKTLTHAAKRSTDLVARYGGEEFIIVLPETGFSGALHVVRMIQKQLRDLNLPHINSYVVPRVTLSFGIASHYPNPKDVPKLLMDQADTALYRAKAAGRNGYAINRSGFFQ